MRRDPMRCQTARPLRDPTLEESDAIPPGRVLRGGLSVREGLSRDVMNADAGLLLLLDHEFCHHPLQHIRVRLVHPSHLCPSLVQHDQWP